MEIEVYRGHAVESGVFVYEYIDKGTLVEVGDITYVKKNNGDLEERELNVWHEDRREAYADIIKKLREVRSRVFKYIELKIQKATLEMGEEL